MQKCCFKTSTENRNGYILIGNKNIRLWHSLDVFWTLTTSLFDLNAIVAFDWCLNALFYPSVNRHLLMFLIYVHYSVLQAIPRNTCLCNLPSNLFLLWNNFPFQVTFSFPINLFLWCMSTILKKISYAIFIMLQLSVSLESRVVCMHNVDAKTMTLIKYTSTIQ